MYFKQDPCPLEAMKEMQFCAAQGQDHRPCCARNGVTTTLAGAKCLTFCDQRPGTGSFLCFFSSIKFIRKFKQIINIYQGCLL